MVAAAALVLSKPDVVFSPSPVYIHRPLTFKSMISVNVNPFSNKLSLLSLPKTFSVIDRRITATTSNTLCCSSVNLKTEEKKMIGVHPLNISILSDCITLSNLSASNSKVFDNFKRMLISFLLYGILGFMGMTMLRNSALAASYGRMGGSSSSSSSSSPSSSSSSPSSSSRSPSSSSWSRSSSSRSPSCCWWYYPSRSRRYNSTWWTNSDHKCIKCNCDKVGRKRYKCTCRCHYKLPNTCTKCVSSTSSVTCTDCNCDTRCTCNCHKEHDELSSPCTNCNCNKEKGGDKLKQPFVKIRRRDKCTCTCDCHRTYPTHCWCDAKEVFEKILLKIVAPLDWLFSVVERMGILPTLLVSTSIVAILTINIEEMEKGNGSVLMLQVGVLDKKRELQKKLNKIAKSADTSSLSGLNFILKGVVKALLQHYGSCHFAYLSVTYDNKDCEQCFRNILSRELGRYDKEEETFTNVNGIKHEKGDIGKACSSGNAYEVVTVLVHISGEYSIPSLDYDVEHVKTVLQEIEWIRESKIKSVEVLWTPQKEDEIISEQELCRDFELLKPVNLSGNVSNLN